MPAPRKSKPSPQKPATALDARQRQLFEQQEKLRRQMEELQRKIEEAPKLAQEQQRRRREELLSRSTRGVRRLDAPTRRDDNRFEVTMTGALASPKPRRALRSQQRQARLIFCALLFLLICLVVWVFSVWRW